jgi:hypothetical protein
MANLKLKTQFNDLVDASVVENQIEDLTSSLDDYALKQQQAFIAPTLLNSWVNFGSGTMPTGYMKDEFGFVHLRGFIKDGTTTAYTTILTLPVGYRPPHQVVLPIASNDLFALAIIGTSGNVDVLGVSSVYISLDSITFKVA